MNKQVSYILISAIVVGIIAYLLALWWARRRLQALPVATTTPLPATVPASPVVMLPPAPAAPTSSIPEPTPPPPAPPPIVVVTTVPAPEPTPPVPAPSPVTPLPVIPTYAVPTIVQIGSDYFLKGIPAPYDSYPIVRSNDYTPSATETYPVDPTKLGSNAEDYYYIYVPYSNTGAVVKPANLIATRMSSPTLVIGGLSGQPLQLRNHGFGGFTVNPARRFLLNPAKNLIGGTF